MLEDKFAAAWLMLVRKWLIMTRIIYTAAMLDAALLDVPLAFSRESTTAAFWKGFPIITQEKNIRLPFLDLDVIFHVARQGDHFWTKDFVLLLLEGFFKTIPELLLMHGF